MNRFVVYSLALMVILAGCKSNEKAYNEAFQKLKEKNEENTLAERAKTATAMSNEAVVQRMDAKNSETAEVVSILEGKEKDLSVYNIVIKSFINRTNAYSLYSRMKDAGYPAVLAQNKDR
ncbi:MAG: hypothetical protein Q8914_13060, partial [Bacteroidota bacterium]|nr:hypothetical protein [Bacteroidota bacterium]